MPTSERQLLLCSGGFDSISLLVLEKAKASDIVALFFDYGQMNAAEERAAAVHFCKSSDVPIIEATIAGAFPKNGLSSEDEAGTFLEGKSRFFLPMRNAVFVSLAASWALKHDCTTILVGSVAADETHLDSGPVYFEQMKALVAQCTNGKVRVDFPLAGMKKAEVYAAVAKHHPPAEIMQRSYSCYYPRSSPKVRSFEWGFGCGSCLSCRGRRAAVAGDDL
jgi:7-cyano-7-deazaguanine synthase